MLGKRSLMGHGIHLSDKELKILHKTKTSIIHCPTSNAPIKDKGLGSGLFDFKKLEKAKVSWAMGSDIGGGPFLSMFDVMRSYVDQNKKKKVSGATFVKALYRSTLAGAEILGISKHSGNFAKNKDANFIVVPLKATLKPKNAEDALKKLIEPFKLKRQNYDSLVSHTCLKGTFIYKSH
jgi:guanine deaminase